MAILQLEFMPIRYYSWIENYPITPLSHLICRTLWNITDFITLSAVGLHSTISTNNIEVQFPQSYSNNV